MEANQPSGNATFDAAINALATDESLQDPARVLHLLVSGPDTATGSQLNRLWRLAVTQSVLAELRVATGDRHFAQWQQAWKRVERVLLDVMVKSDGGDGLEQAMAAYAGASRAAAAGPDFTANMQRLEGILQCQRALIAFHWNKDENSYRRREAELSERLAATLKPLQALSFILLTEYSV